MKFYVDEVAEIPSETKKPAMEMGRAVTRGLIQ